MPSLPPDRLRFSGSFAPGRGGFTLIEVAVAIGIVAFALVCLIGLASRLMQQGGESARQTALVGIARKLEVQYRVITADLETNRQEEATYRFSLDGHLLGMGTPQEGDATSWIATVKDATPPDYPPAHRVTLITLRSRFQPATEPGKRFLVSGRWL